MTDPLFPDDPDEDAPAGDPLEVDSETTELEPDTDELEDSTIPGVKTP